MVKSIYYSVKQVSDTLFSGSGEAFRKVLLVRYPHPEAWSVAFQTGHPAWLHLNRVLAIACGARDAALVKLDLYRVG